MASLRACLHGGGVPHGGEVTRLSIKSLILMWWRLHVRWGDPPYVTSRTWGPPLPRKQALCRVTWSWGWSAFQHFLHGPAYQHTSSFWITQKKMKNVVTLKSFASVTRSLDNDAVKIVTLNIPLTVKKKYIPQYPTNPTSTWMRYLFQCLTASIFLLPSVSYRLWDSVGIIYQFFPLLYIVVQFVLGINFKFLYFWVGLCVMVSLKRVKTKFKPEINWTSTRRFLHSVGLSFLV